MNPYIALLRILFLSILILAGCQNGGFVDPGNTISGVDTGKVEEAITTNLTAGKSVPETLQATIDSLKTQDNVSDAGYTRGGGGVWAKLKGGGYHVIVFNPGTPDNLPTVTQKGVYSGLDINRSSQSRFSSAKLASAGDMMSFIQLRTGSSASVGLLADMAQKAGYTQATAFAPVPGEADVGTIDWFTNIHVYRLIYLDTAAVCFNPDEKYGEPTYWAIMTADTFSPTLQAKYSDDIANDRILTGTIIRDYGDLASANPSFESRYFITHKFFEKYNDTFDPGSTVYIDGCGTWAGSYLPDFTGLYQALHEFKKAACVAGWSGTPAPSDAFSAASYFFSRMFGDNRYHAASPPNRPYGFSDSFSGLTVEKLNVAAPASAYENDPLASLVQPELQAVFPENDSDDPLWRPGLETFYLVLTDNSTSKLVVGGDFGEDPVTLSIGNKTFTLNPDPESTTSREVNIGAEDFGNMQVMTSDGKLKSNIIPLSQWKGTFTETGVWADRGPKVDVTLNVRFRGDSHGYRVVPDGVLFNFVENGAASILFEYDCVGTYAFSGKYQVGDVQYTWTGGGSIDFNKPPSPLGVMTTDSGTAKFNFAPLETFTAQATWVNVKTHETGTTNQGVALGFEVTTPIDKNGNIQSKTMKDAISGKLTVTIPAMTPNPAPDDAMPR